MTEKELYQIIQSDLDDLKNFILEINNYLESVNKKGDYRGGTYLPLKGDVSPYLFDKREIIISTCKQFNIALVYIFGSRVREDLKVLNNARVKVEDPLTDVDIGIVFKKEMPEKARYRLYSNIYNAFSELFLPLKLDLTFLQENHAVLQSQALLGECIYFFDQEYKDSYEDKILVRAADFQYVLDKYYEEKMAELV